MSVACGPASTLLPIDESTTEMPNTIDVRDADPSSAGTLSNKHNEEPVQSDHLGKITKQ